MCAKGTEIQQVARLVGSDTDLQQILDSIQDEILVIDSKYRVKWANPAALARLQKDMEFPIGRLCYEVCYGRDNPCSAPLGDCPLKEALGTGKMTSVIHSVCTPDTETYLKVIAYPLWDSHDNAPAIIEVRRDVIADMALDVPTLRRYHQLEVLERVSSTANGPQDLDTVLNIALDNILEIVKATFGGILLMDKEPGLLYYRVHSGLSAKNIDEIRIPLGKGIAGRVAQTGMPIFTEDVSRDPRVLQMELGGVEHLRAFVSVPLKRRDEIVGAMVVASHETGKFGADDISILSSISDYLATAVVRSTVERKISKGMARYQALLQYALGAQEDERKRVARELHDESSQALTSLTFRLQAAIQMAETKGFGDTKFKESLRKAHSCAVQAGNELVKLMMDLRPTLLDDLGMPAAIHRYAKDTLEAKGINVTMEFMGREYRLPAEVEVAFFRVAQGLISNILRHSEAKNVSIKVECDASKAVLYIEDDGIGFDVDKLTEVEPSGRGAGLFTMRERLHLVGGSGHIESGLGKGTKITVTVPITRDLEDLADEQDNGDDC